MKRMGVLRFPGTNCDRDIFKAIEEMGWKAHWLWHQDSFDPKEFDGYFVPGGFSYGDYLRAGALAARSPVMVSLIEANKLGKPILGICNGFQILCEAGLLPGALMKNVGGRFIDKWVKLKPVSKSSLWSIKGEGLDLPIAHGEGNYYADTDCLKKLFDEDQVWLTYEENLNGSLKNIAGVLNEKKNVAGLMPHPERAMHKWMGGADGRELLNVLEG